MKMFIYPVFTVLFVLVLVAYADTKTEQDEGPIQSVQ